MSIVLAFDCAVTGLGVAVLRGETVLATVVEEGRDQAARLLPAIATALDQAGIARRAVGLVAVTTGPGSFTGVRVGLAAARGLAVGLDVPLAGVATTSVLLAQAPPSGQLPIAAIDSQLGDWFCAMAEGEAPFLASADDLAGRLRGRACAIVGSGTHRLAADLVDRGIAATAEEAVPDPVVLARLAAAPGIEAWRERNAREGLPRPLYLRGVNVTLPDGARRTVE
ncbi:tRNA (adenosine(37)-N6)-threonylcarbamoyltransferase complex dimerization subunit type 1 TsaB [Reyranella sp.]|uniref:tRNA (adenosine(37)-N6)-threonylcarbamoyltransferase complex dimerization subunit type 1 TsaB n=1 Tax=Reyranella sp. TaxID=1929291 RepID=UPI003BAC0952